MDNPLNKLGISRNWKVRNPRPLRGMYGLQTVCAVLLFFLLLRPDWLPQWLYWGAFSLGVVLTLVEMALDYRRRRPRQRWRDVGVALLSLSVVWIVIMPPFLFWGVSDERELAWATLGLGVITLVAGMVCLLRWLRLRAEAEMRLWQLTTERRKRSRLRARAEAEGGVI